MVGPGFPPIPAKLIAAITSGKFVEQEDLLSSNLASPQDDEQQLLLDGRVVLTTGKRKPKHIIESIVSWIEAFTIYTLILTSSFPNRWRDLSSYKLLILRTYQHFGSRAWLSYNRAYRELVAATGLADWSELNMQLFNFHTTCAPACGSGGLDSPHSFLRSSTSSKKPGLVPSTIISGEAIDPRMDR